MAPEKSEHEKLGILTFGLTTDESSAGGKRWRDAILDLAVRIEKSVTGYVSPLELNVVFQIPGKSKLDYTGIQTGLYSKKMATLLVKVAVPEELPDDVSAATRQLTHQAIEVAATWAEKRRLEFDKQLFHSLIERAANLESTCLPKL